MNDGLEIRSSASLESAKGMKLISPGRLSPSASHISKKGPSGAPSIQSFAPSP